MGTGVFLWVKRPRSGVDHPPPSSAEVKERVELYIPLIPLWVFVAVLWRTFTFTFFTLKINENCSAVLESDTKRRTDRQGKTRQTHPLDLYGAQRQLDSTS
jgi:hypothetical protein